MVNLRSKNWAVSCLGVVLIAILTVPVSANWQPGKVAMMTKWAEEVSPGKHPSHGTARA